MKIIITIEIDNVDKWEEVKAIKRDRLGYFPQNKIDDMKNLLEEVKEEIREGISNMYVEEDLEINCKIENKSVDSTSILKETLEHIINLSEDRGVKGCTYGDTDYDSISFVEGYNFCLSNIKEVAQKAIDKIK
jgi:hypothetical protein